MVGGWKQARLGPYVASVARPSQGGQLTRWLAPPRTGVLKSCVAFYDLAQKAHGITTAVFCWSEAHLDSRGRDTDLPPALMTSIKKPPTRSPQLSSLCFLPSLLQLFSDETSPQSRLLGPWSSSISIPWGLVRNPDFQTPPQTC